MCTFPSQYQIQLLFIQNLINEFNNFKITTVILILVFF
jgi:hypothetical protein